MAKISRPKGVSKREAAAAKAGGKLDYKSGKITVKKPTYKPPTGYGMSGGSSDEETMQLRSGVNQSGQSYGPAYQDQYILDYVKKDQENQKSNRERAYQVSQSNSQPSLGNKIVNTLGGINTANAQGNNNPNIVRPNVGTKIGRVLQVLADPTGILPKFNQTFGTNIRKPDFGISEVLGLDNVIEKPGGLIYNTSQEPQPYDDPITGERSIIEPSYPSSPANNNYAPNDGRPYVDNPNYQTKRTNTPDRVKTPTTSIFTNPSQGISDPITEAINRLRPQDQSYNNNQNEMSIRRPVGSGTFSNGKGNYGYAGLFGSPVNKNINSVDNINNGLVDNTNPVQDLINNLLGIETAQTQEVNPMNIGQESYRETTNPVQGVTPQSEWTMQNGNPEWNRFDQNTEQNNAQVNQPNVNPMPSYSGGGVAQNYSQQLTGDTNSYAKQYAKQQKAAEKALEKQLKEMLKSIEATYAQSTAEGTGALEGQKRQALDALNSQFSFGLNQDPNSEQRIQYNQRTQQDYAGQLTSLLNKLAAAKAGEISSARQNYQQNKATLAEKFASMISAAQKDAQDQQYKMAMLRKSSGGSGSAGALTYLGDDPSGQAVYYNSKTGWRGTIPGVKKPNNNPFASLGIGIQSQGGNMEQLPDGTWVNIVD